MRHAAPKAHKAAGAKSLTNLFTTHHGSHSPQTVYAEKAAAGNAEALGIDDGLAARLNEVAPLTRRSIRESAKAAQRRNTVLTSASLAALVGTAATSMAFMKSQDDTTTFAADGAETTQTINISRVTDGAASRSDAREELTDGVQQGTDVSTSNDGDWNIGDSNTISDVNALTKAKANNEKVAERVDKDEADLPADFNANHPTGNTAGNAYPYGQCTWWAFERRQQLGLDTGSFFGDARNWGTSAQSLGYWVDNKAREVGDVLVFSPGQEGADGYYGHVAVVEAINPDGSIKISESNVQGPGVITEREFSADKVSGFTFVHY